MEEDDQTVLGPGVENEPNSDGTEIEASPEYVIVVTRELDAASLETVRMPGNQPESTGSPTEHGGGQGMTSDESLGELGGSDTEMADATESQDNITTLHDSILESGSRENPLGGSLGIDDYDLLEVDVAGIDERFPIDINKIEAANALFKMSDHNSSGSYRDLDGKVALSCPTPQHSRKLNPQELLQLWNWIFQANHNQVTKETDGVSRSS